MSNSTRLHGTFLVLLRRQNCVIIASDTAAHNGERPVPGIHHKIICHPTLPLAIAIGGTASFELSGRTIKVEEFIRDQFDKWSTVGPINRLTIKTWAESVISPLIRNLNEESDDKVPQAYISLLVGLCIGNYADSVSLEIRQDGEVHEKHVNENVIYHPATLLDWTNNTLMKQGDVYGNNISHVNELVEKAKSIVESAIAAERAIDPPVALLECGGPVEVVLVQPVNARFVVSAPPPAS